MVRHGPRGHRLRALGFNAKAGLPAPREDNNVLFKCDLCNEDSDSPKYRPCRRDAYLQEPYAGNYHIGQTTWADNVIASGKAFVFDKEGRKHNLTFLPLAKPYHATRSNLVRWRRNMFGSVNRIKSLSRSGEYRFKMTDQAHWHQDVDNSIPDPVARRNIVTLKDTQGGFHEIFMRKPAPEDEYKARRDWRSLMVNLCATFFGGEVGEAVPVPRYLWARPEEEVGSPVDDDAPGAASNPASSGQAFRLDLPQSARCRTSLPVTNWRPKH
ncbi:hypothetical protein J7T55_013094 [Diaporthe amygdali]|uniref:uncharacterized protein n=1 Tax=Phomopsis amygdali TaxID=1214568 RepID=UPI0022FDDACE|nr:uncharacterized protein J7T55_013094 [Diaporthe amygdali]KAJ0118838.1 hypothetical protein J7T55_013094 [Diaporthe amygdali]